MMKILQVSLLKSTLVLLIVMFLSTGDLAAQTPQFYNYNNGTSYNSFPLNVVAGKMVQTLIAAGEFNQPTPATAGNITKYSLRISTGYPLGPATYTSFRILFTQAAITVLPTGSFYSGTWDTVYQRASVTLSAAADTWLTITLDHPYAYNPAQGLIVQIEQCGATGTTTGYCIQQTSTPGVGRRSYSSGACPYVYGGLTTSVINCGIDVEPNIPVPVGNWNEQTSGLTSVLYSVSAVSDTVAWVCGASGKVLRTTSLGYTWTNVSGTIPTTYTLYSIFAWDANTAIVTGVAGTNTAIYTTSNGGATWALGNSHSGFGDDLYMTSVTDAYFIGDPIAGNWDLLKSTNSGVNWASWTTLLTTNTLGTYNNAAWFQGSQVWFPSVGQSKMLYSSNMGTNWAEQTIPLSEITATCFANPTIGLAGGSSTSPGLIKTTDAGITWTALILPFTGSVTGIVGVQNSWWLSQQGLTIAYSTNAGANWFTQYTAPAGNFYHMSKSRRGATIWAVRSNGGISRFGNPLVGINPVSSETPTSYSLSQNYPNPFNPVTKINYALPKSGFVTLKVYDVLGSEVVNLVSENKVAGNYSVDFNASSLPSGLYFYSLNVNGFSETKKMTLIK